MRGSGTVHHLANRQFGPG